MKFSVDIVIDASLDAVWQLFDNPNNMKKWQPTLESFKHKSGDPGQPGAVAELIYDEKRRKIPIIETVTERRKPYFMAGTYESAMGKAIIVNHFEEVEENRTRWVMYTNHTFNGIFKLLSIFFGGSIRKRNEDVMNNFKLFAETEQAERAR